MKIREAWYLLIIILLGVSTIYFYTEWQILETNRIFACSDYD